jgi:hypothetical protein
MITAPIEQADHIVQEVCKRYVESSIPVTAVKVGRETPGMCVGRKQTCYVPPVMVHRAQARTANLSVT